MPHALRRLSLPLVASSLLLASSRRPARASAAGTKAAPASALKIQVEKSKVDLKNHRLEVKLARPAGKVKIVVTSESDAVLADEEQDFTGRPAGIPLIVTWNPSSDAAVGKIDVRAFDTRGLGSASSCPPGSSPSRTRTSTQDRIGGDRTRPRAPSWRRPTPS